MKRSVSLVLSLVTSLGMLGACSAAAAGKDQVASVCSEKSASSINCSCFTAALESNLAPEQFARVAKAIEENRRFSGLVPGEIANDASLGLTVAQAQLSCAA